MSGAGFTMQSERLNRRLGYWSSVGIVIGVTIGSGIFRTPATIAARVPNPRLMLGVWVLGGAVTLCGALSIAELSARVSGTGGLYVYLRESWGRGMAFVFVWAELILISSAALAGIASVFGEYLLRSLGYDTASHPRAADWAAVAAIVIATAANVRGVRAGAAVIGASTVAKFGALAFLVGAAFLLGGHAGGSTTHFATLAGQTNAGAFGLAFISVLWAYDGFADLPFVGGEVVDAQRTIPRAIIGGTLAIIAIYLAANVAYVYILPIDRITASPLIAADTMEALFGRAGVSFVALAVMLSTFGAVNAHMLGVPRIFFAAADDALFFKALARIHPRYRTPHVSILANGALGIVFVLTGTFEQLADTFVLAVWPFYGLAVAGLYRLRHRAHGAGQYAVPGYPIVPAIFIAACGLIVISGFIEDPLWTSATLGIVLAGIPVYYFAFSKTRASAGPLSR